MGFKAHRWSQIGDRLTSLEARIASIDPYGKLSESLSRRRQLSKSPDMHDGQGVALTAALEVIEGLKRDRQVLWQEIQTVRQTFDHYRSTVHATIESTVKARMQEYFSTMEASFKAAVEDSITETLRGYAEASTPALPHTPTFDNITPIPGAPASALPNACTTPSSAIHPSNAVDLQADSSRLNDIPSIFENGVISLKAAIASFPDLFKSTPDDLHPEDIPDFTFLTPYLDSTLPWSLQ